MLRVSRAFRTIAQIFGLLLPPVVAVAQGASTQVSYGLSGPLLAIAGVDLQNPASPVSVSFSNGDAFATLYAWPEVGQLHASAVVHVPPSSRIPPDSWAGALVRATWYDEVVISSSGLTGQTGYARAAIHYSWTLGLSDPGPTNSFAQGDIKMSVSGGFVNYYAEIGDALSASACGMSACPAIRTATLVGSGTPPTSVSPGPGTLFLDFGFTFGTPFALSASLTAYAYPYGSLTSAGDSFADASHSAVWGGLFDVIQASTGNPVSYELSSASGFDYRQAAAVPEPSTDVLLTFGLFTLIVCSTVRQSGKSHLIQSKRWTIDA